MRRVRTLQQEGDIDKSYFREVLEVRAKRIQSSRKSRRTGDKQTEYSQIQSKEKPRSRVGEGNEGIQMPVCF